MSATASRLTGVYPGTFDPVTLGHLDVIRRAMKVVDHLVVAVADNPGKNPLFSTTERVAMLEQDIAAMGAGTSFTVVAFDGLLMDFAAAQKARVIVRGLRAVSDFEYEFQMTGMNAYLNRDIETVFLMSQDKYQFISSRFVKEIARLGGDIGHFVSAATAARTHEKFSKTIT